MTTSPAIGPPIAKHDSHPAAVDHESAGDRRLDPRPAPITNPGVQPAGDRATSSRRRRPWSYLRPPAHYPIDLATALRLADVSNPTIGAARTMILEALALQLTARTPACCRH